MQTCETLINLKGIRFSYEASKPVLNGVNLLLKKGDRVGLTGANGSGKTTLLMVLVGLVKPTEGTVEIFGRQRTKERDFKEIREKIGFLFQNPDDQLFCPTVIEDVAFGPLNLGMSRKEAIEIADRVLSELGLSHLRERGSHRLSGGEKRLVSLATVLAMNPKILLLDEPVAGLDEETTATVTEILERLPQERIVVAHDKEFLKRVTNQLFSIRKGVITPLGELENLAEREKSPILRPEGRAE
ncbi:MAG: energy-coupling factor ABC transporter ATP-binding protein [Planctomycetota bacterium]|nr:energy-coupling factor ABC transporter ATP-binding protein [Planctomycetota bacterium]